MIFGAPKLFFKPQTYISPESVTAREYFLAWITFMLQSCYPFISTLKLMTKILSRLRNKFFIE
jgi:hypothetical protein